MTTDTLFATMLAAGQRKDWMTPIQPTCPTYKVWVDVDTLAVEGVPS